MQDFLFRGSLADIDPHLFELAELEAERQYRKLILIPSESTAPRAVREALSSTFQNIYAEGYPDEATRLFGEDMILDYESILGHFRRFSDPRYYKGVEYANVVEALARRRCAEVFAANNIEANDLYINVQPLSGAPANNAVYHALINPGDTIMGMDLLHGGHLSHGSPVHRSGKIYNAIHYTIDPITELINYQFIMDLALKYRPKVIVAGYSSYPWTVDWSSFREIADASGAYLMADIAHVAGLVAGGVYPSPIGFADVITFTTHKSLCGPRGACIITADPILSRKIDRAIFPGEQGGPHVNVFLAMAVAFKLAKSDQFKQLQTQIVKNCSAFINRFSELGLKIPFGGGNTHLMNLDVSTIKSNNQASLSGDQAARILDIVGIVVNRNTIPGDKSAVDPSGIRMGTPWVTQRGFLEKDMVKLADIIASLFKAITPFSIMSKKGKTRRAKVEFKALEEAKIKVRDMAIEAGIDYEPSSHDYPHFYYLEEKSVEMDGWKTIHLEGLRVQEFLNYALSCDVSTLEVGESIDTSMETPFGLIEGVLICNSVSIYQIDMLAIHANTAATWLRDLSDGFVNFGIGSQQEDLLISRLPGPITVRIMNEKSQGQRISHTLTTDRSNGKRKPFFIGNAASSGNSLPPFEWTENDTDQVKRTPLYDLHKELGAKMIPFAGWEMPVWYTTVLDEHKSNRDSVGLFDVSHMGIYQVEGKNAVSFLDSVCGNNIGNLTEGESCYTHFLDSDANVIDDTLVYCRSKDVYLLVVNASNDAKDWAWLTKVLSGVVKIDNIRPWAKTFGSEALIRNLRNQAAGEDMLVDLALQGPKSLEILLSLECDEETRNRVKTLKRTQLCHGKIDGSDAIISRTGYTGEKMGFEIFIHPTKAPGLFMRLLKVGEQLGIKPIGLGARDSLRTEAGLPLYGHEMGKGSGKLGMPDLGVGEAGFGNYVKIDKPWFIGRQAFIEREKQRTGIVVRFRFNERGVRMAHPGDPVMDKRGKIVGWVTSCAVDYDGFLTGQAFVEERVSEPGGLLYLSFQNYALEKSLSHWKLGEKINIPSPITVMNRFP